MKSVAMLRWRFSGFLALFVVLACTGCRRSAPQALPPPLVQMLEVSLTNAPRSASFIGQLDSPQNVEVRARVEAFVEQVLFTEGKEVRAGDLLYVLDKRPFEEQLAAARGMLAEARAALGKYEKDVARLRPLAEKRAIPQQDLDNALAAVDSGKAGVQSAEARVRSAELNLSYCEIRAPLSGLIGAREVSVGSLVGRGEPTLLATISTLDPIWFYCAISEVDYLKSQRMAREEGRELSEIPVQLMLADGSEHPETGKWVFVDRAVNATTGTIRARAEFRNAKRLLRPGMFARAKVTVVAPQGGILIPQRAVTELQGKSFVWVVDGENRASQRLVQVAPYTSGGSVAVTEGLKPGERIVLEGLQKLREGGLVQPIPAMKIAKAGADDKGIQ